MDPSRARVPTTILQAVLIFFMYAVCPIDLALPDLITAKIFPADTIKEKT
jgi:uncharacterized membrane protein YkvA (DUF1232 family)